MAKRLDSLRARASQFAHSTDCEIWTLSVSDAQLEISLCELGRLVPELNRTKRRMPSRRPNHLAVVTLIKIGTTSALFGADLEKRASARVLTKSQDICPSCRPTQGAGTVARYLNLRLNKNVQGHLPSAKTFKSLNLRTSAPVANAPIEGSEARSHGQGAGRVARYLNLRLNKNVQGHLPGTDATYNRGRRERHPRCRKIGKHRDTTFMICCESCPL
jgi:hypothetical protein